MKLLFHFLAPFEHGLNASVIHHCPCYFSGTSTSRPANAVCAPCCCLGRQCRCQALPGAQPGAGGTCWQGQVSQALRLVPSCKTHLSMDVHSGRGTAFNLLSCWTNNRCCLSLTVYCCVTAPGNQQNQGQ